LHAKFQPGKAVKDFPFEPGSPGGRKLQRTALAADFRQSELGVLQSAAEIADAMLVVSGELFAGKKAAG
jgi:hypothetical protein